MEDSKTVFCSLKFRWSHEGISPKFTIRARVRKKFANLGLRGYVGPRTGVDALEIIQSLEPDGNRKTIS
jgi:hypothetical protein